LTPSPRNHSEYLHGILKVRLPSRNYRIIGHILRRLHGSVYSQIFLVGSTVFVIFLVGSVKRFFVGVRFSRSRAFKVIDFGTSRKRVCDFLLVRHSNLGPILHRFGTLNIRSLLNKFDEVVEVCRDQHLDVLCLTETWHDLDSPVIGRLQAPGRWLLRHSPSTPTYRRRHIIEPWWRCYRRPSWHHHLATAVAV